MAEAALTLAKGEVDGETQATQAKAELSAGLADLQTENAQLTDQAVSTGSYNTSKDFAENWANAYASVNDMAYQTAVNQVSYSQSVEENKTPDKQEVGKVDYRGANNVGEGVSDIMEKTKSALETNQSQTTEFWADLAERYAAMADAAGDSAASLEGGMAQIAAQLAENKINFSTIGAGAGPNETGKAEILDFLEKSLDLYQQIDKEIEGISRELDRLSNLQEKLTGKALQANLDKQLETLKKQEKAYEKKLELAKAEAAIQAATLKGYGITFDKMVI